MIRLPVWSIDRRVVRVVRRESDYDTLLEEL